MADIEEIESLFSDLQPLPQIEPQPLVPIAYPENCNHLFSPTVDLTRLDSKAMGYFRAVLKTNEISHRALLLTRLIISENPGHYSIWVYRRRLLEELKVDLASELELLNGLMEEYAKSYQLWYVISLGVKM